MQNKLEYVGLGLYWIWKSFQILDMISRILLEILTELMKCPKCLLDHFE